MSKWQIFTLANIFKVLYGVGSELGFICSAMPKRCISKVNIFNLSCFTYFIVSLGGISESVFYGNLVYKFEIIVGKPSFNKQFKKIVKLYKRVRYNMDTGSCDSLH